MEPALEQRLVRRAGRGDRSAFERLYRAHAPSLLRRVIRPRVPDEAAAEDVLVETFATAWDRLDGFEWQGRSLYHWLARVAANRCVDIARRRDARRRHEQAAATDQLVTRGGRVEPYSVAHLDRVRVRRRIDAVLAELNPRYAQALTLRLLEGRPRAACAEALGCRLGTFDVVLLRAVRAFRKRWEARYGTFEEWRMGHG